MHFYCVPCNTAPCKLFFLFVNRYSCLCICLHLCLCFVFAFVFCVVFVFVFCVCICVLFFCVCVSCFVFVFVLCSPQHGGAQADPGQVSKHFGRQVIDGSRGHKRGLHMVCIWTRDTACAFEHGTQEVRIWTRDTACNWCDTTNSVRHCFHCLWNLFRNTPHCALQPNFCFCTGESLWCVPQRSYTSASKYETTFAENMRQLSWRKFAENMTTGHRREASIQKNLWTASVAEFYDQFLAVIWINIWWCFGQWGGNKKTKQVSALNKKGVPALQYSCWSLGFAQYI